jgi:hypothetical protein
MSRAVLIQEVYERCGDCVWFRGQYYPPYDGLPEEYNGECNAPGVIYQFKINGDTKFKNGFPQGCPLEEG